jgi:hypothetical protein
MGEKKTEGEEQINARLRELTEQTRRLRSELDELIQDIPEQRLRSSSADTHLRFHRVPSKRSPDRE